MEYKVEINLNQTLTQLRRESEEKFDNKHLLGDLITDKLGIEYFHITNTQPHIYIYDSGDIIFRISEYDIISDVLSNISNLEIKNIQNYVPEKAGVFKDYIESKLNKENKYNILKILEEK